MSSIGVLLVTYNQYDITKKFILNYIQCFPLEKYKLLILDNNSSDMTFEKIKEEFPEIDIRKLNGNYGCVTGRNIGILELIKLESNYIFISDNDIVFKDSETLNKLGKFMQSHPELAGCCPIVRWFDDESIQTLGTREVRKNWFKNVSVLDNNIFVNSLPGCAQFVKSSTFKKYGVYDNDLSPISIEDLEWGMRATKNGAKLAYVNNCEVYHIQKRNVKNSREKTEHVIKGRGVFLRKYFSLQSIAREFRNFIYFTYNYGFIFTIRAYKKGLTKKIEKDNYNFDKFKETISKYVTDIYFTHI